MSFADASIMLKEELKFPEERANYYVKKFDKNGDGKLSVAEFHEFKRNIEETLTKLNNSIYNYTLSLEYCIYIYTYIYIYIYIHYNVNILIRNNYLYMSVYNLLHILFRMYYYRM